MSADATGTGVVSHAGTVLLLRTAEKTGLTAALSTALGPWRKPLAKHDPGKIVLDLDATLVTAHSEKEKAAPNYKRGYSFHPLCAFVDHGDHITGVKDALAQLPSDPDYRVARKVLIRSDGAGGTDALIEYLTNVTWGTRSGSDSPTRWPRRSH